MPAFFHGLGSLTFVSATPDDDLLLVPGKATALWLREPAAKVSCLLLAMAEPLAPQSAFCFGAQCVE